jgi:lantibiotic modifying enzyme
MKTPWKPLLDGRVADDALKAIWDIAHDLRSAEGRGYPTLDGDSGLAIFFAYLAQATDNDELAEAAVGCLDRALETVARQPTPPALYGGLSGPGWVLEHLQGRLLEEPPDDGDPGDDLAAILLEHLRLRQPDPSHDYDLISGLVGLGVYALEALPRRAAAECLEILVEHLEAISEESNGGVRWFTPPNLLPDHQREVAPNGYWNLGVAHGIPGVVGVLTRIHAAGLARERVRPLVGKAVQWILDQQTERNGLDSCIPTWIADGGDNPSRPGPAWCYGDLGVAAVLALAGRLMDEVTWVTEAVEMAKYAAARSMTPHWRTDTGLCHGAAGIAHLLNRIWQATGSTGIESAARHWFERLLEQRDSEQGYGGFLALHPTPEDVNQLRWEEDPTFLTGSAGIGLALMGAVFPLEPDWDRLLLVNIPPGVR